MRNLKARIKYNKKNEIVAAFPADYACNEDEIANDWVTEGTGYISVPLKKATSRNKGNSLERDVAKAFSMWLYGQEGIITRTPLSGGWNGSKLGDVTADPSKLMEMKLPIPKLYVECKNREGLLSEEFFNWMASGSPKRMSEWIEDTKKKAGVNHWFIILKGRSTDPWVFTYLTEGIGSYNLQVRMDGGTVYIMYPLKQLGAINTYTSLHRLITGV